VQVTEIPSGLLVKYLKYGVYPQEFTVSNKETIGCNYEKKVPPGIRKSMSVSKDFKGFAFESYDKFGEIFVERLEEKLTEQQNGQ
jgi:hypothetical protein